MPTNSHFSKHYDIISNKVSEITNMISRMKKWKIVYFVQTAHQPGHTFAIISKLFKGSIMSLHVENRYRLEILIISNGRQEVVGILFTR